METGLSAVALAGVLGLSIGLFHEFCLDLTASKGTLHWKLQLPTCPTPQEAPFTSTPGRAKF